jgi:hypothetical protein
MLVARCWWLIAGAGGWWLVLVLVLVLVLRAGCGVLGAECSRWVLG